MGATPLAIRTIYHAQEEVDTMCKGRCIPHAWWGHTMRVVFTPHPQDPVRPFSGGGMVAKEAGKPESREGGRNNAIDSR